MEFREKKRWGFFGLPFTFTTYMVTEELITVEEGFINKRENDCYIYKVCLLYTSPSPRDRG